ERLINLTEIRVECRRLINNQHRILQVIKNGGISFPYNWHQPFPTDKAFGFVGKNRAIAKRAGVAIVCPAFPSYIGPFPKISRSHSQFAHGNDFDFAQLRCRELCFRIEGADGVYFVAKKFDAHRLRVARRPNVENAAAHGKLADGADWILTYETGGYEL